MSNRDRSPSNPSGPVAQGMPLAPSEAPAPDGGVPMVDPVVGIPLGGPHAGTAPPVRAPRAGRGFRFADTLRVTLVTPENRKVTGSASRARFEGYLRAVGATAWGPEVVGRTTTVGAILALHAADPANAPHRGDLAYDSQGHGGKPPSIVIG